MTRVLSIPGRNHGNPFFALIGDALEHRGCAAVPPRPLPLLLFRYDVLHLNFPTHYISENGAAKAWLTSALLAAYLGLARLLGRHVIYTVHDVVPFRSRHPFLSRRFLSLVHRLTGLFVFLSRSSRDAFVQLYPADAGKPWVLALHGPYKTTPITSSERARRRREMLGDTDGFLVGFLGTVKPYKNVAALRALPPTLPDGRKLRALIAGHAEPDSEAELAALLDALPPGQAIRRPASLPAAKLDRLIQCMDVVLLPYLKGTNSGIALLVLSNGTPLIGSALPIFQELAQTVGPPWVYTIGHDDAALPGALQSVAAHEIGPADRERLSRYLESASFANAADLVAAALGRMVERRPRLTKDRPLPGRTW